MTSAAIDDPHPERSELDAEINLDSLDTGNATRDRHLRGESFLDTARYPTATVRLRELQMENDAAFTARIELELHGHVQSFPMRFTIVDRAARRIAGDVVLRRSAFAVGTPRGGTFQVGDAVSVSVDVVVPGMS